MKNMKVATKLISGFLILSFITIIVGLIGVFGIFTLRDQLNRIYDENLLAIEAMGNIQETYQVLRNDLRDLVLASTISTKEAESKLAQMEATEDKLEAAFLEYEKTIATPEDEGAYYQAKEDYYTKYQETKKGIVEEALAGNFKDAYQHLIASAPVVTPIMEGFTASAHLNSQLAKTANEANDSLATILVIVQTVVALLAIAASVFLATYISRLISRPMRFLADYAKEVAETGNLNLVITHAEDSAAYGAQKDEIGETVTAVNQLLFTMEQQAEMLAQIADKDLSFSVNFLSEESTIDAAASKMLSELNTVLSGMQNAAGEVASGAKQMSQSAQALAQGSTQQAATVQELSAAIADVSQRTLNNAQMAEDAAELGNSIRKNAENGNQQMENMMAAVNEIHEASHSISNVIKVIDDIAFQTNILALNAAVEAARAGQHGKGFAVVADEVRSLAAKSADAAKSTGQLIANTIEKAAYGSKVAVDTAQSLAEIVNGISQNSDIVNKIAASSREQSSSIAQINDGVEQVALVVQQNSATSQQSAAVSQEMAAQAQLLAQMVAQFTLKETTHYYTPIPEKSAVYSSPNFSSYSGEQPIF